MWRVVMCVTQISKRCFQALVALCIIAVVNLPATAQAGCVFTEHDYICDGKGANVGAQQRKNPFLSQVDFSKKKKPVASKPQIYSVVDSAEYQAAMRRLEDGQKNLASNFEPVYDVPASAEGGSCSGTLKYPPPKFSDYKIIDLNNQNKTSFSFGKNDKVLFLGSDNKTYSHLRIEGGKDIAIIGGKYAPPSSTTRGGGKSNITGTLYFKNLTEGGSIYIEGVHVDNKDSFGTVGIVLNAGTDGGNVDVTIQNSRVENIDGCKPCSHGDVIQTQGKVKSLKMYNFTGTSGYQGFFLPYQSKPYGGKLKGKVEMENVNLRVIPTKINDHTPHTFWFDTNGAQQISLKNVYSQGGKYVVPGQYTQGGVQSGLPGGKDFVSSNQVGKACRV